MLFFVSQVEYKEDDSTLNQMISEILNRMISVGT